MAAKPGVQSTLILSKTDGTVIQSTGLLAASESEEAIAPQSPSGKTKLEGSENADVRGDGPDQPKRSNTAEDVARMVFAFVTAAKEFSDGMYTTDEVKLLRMRTRKNEIVIVPGMSDANLHLPPLLENAD